MHKISKKVKWLLTRIRQTEGKWFCERCVYKETNYMRHLKDL